MTTWQDVISDFKAEKKEYKGAAATLVLMYLMVIGKGYSYNMAMEFEKGITEKNGWDTTKIHYLRKLRDQNQLHVLLSKMEDRGLIVSAKMDSGRKHRYYCINPRVLIESPDTTSCKYDSAFCTNRGKDPCDRSPKIREERLQMAKEFLNAQRCSDVEFFFKRWSSINTFNFVAFQQLLKDQAKAICFETIFRENRVRRIGEQNRIRLLRYDVMVGRPSQSVVHLQDAPTFNEDDRGPTT